jgi:hypothetical protein
MGSVILTSIGSATVIYELIGTLGYLSLGKLVHPNFILECTYHHRCVLSAQNDCWHYPQDPSSVFVTGGRIALVVLNTFSYPLQAHPCRASLEKVIACLTASTRKNGKAPPPTPFQFFAMTTAILIFSYITAITVTKLDLVWLFYSQTVCHCFQVSNLSILGFGICWIYRVHVDIFYSSRIILCKN